MDDELLVNARKEIDGIDEQMAKLFIKRMEAVRAVAAYKAERGLPVYDPAREAAVIEKNGARVEDDTLRGYYTPFLRETMRLSRAYQERLFNKMKVAYCGVDGAFAAIAASKIAPIAEKAAYPSFKEAYDAVERGDCDCAVLPIENSTTGEVGAVIDLLFFGSLCVTGVYDLPVRHNLLACAGATKESITRVLSHPQALSQCADYLKERKYELTEYANTALAAKYVAEKNDPALAAIASKETAAIFGLKILESNINESDSNWTRFAVVARAYAAGQSGRDRRSILLFTVKNEAGALAKAISVIGAHGFNMQCLRSRPTKELMWKYYFYVELESDLLGERGTVLISELRAFCDKVKILGSYDYPAVLE